MVNERRENQWTPIRDAHTNTLDLIGQLSLTGRWVNDKNGYSMIVDMKPIIVGKKRKYESMNDRATNIDVCHTN